LEPETVQVKTGTLKDRTEFPVLKPAGPVYHSLMPTFPFLLALVLASFLHVGTPVLAPPSGGDEPWVPVLLVPGWGDEAASLEPLRRRFTEAGWPETRVRALSFSDPVGSNAEHALEIERAVRVLRGLTGADRVDVVAHSMGGLATRQFLLRADAETLVRRTVFLGTPHRGTVVAVLSWGDGGREMVPGSLFLTQLNTALPVPLGIEALAIRTPLDLRVIPASSALLRGDGVENLEVCCPTHSGLVDDDRTFREVLAFLRGSRAEAAGEGGP
jgi:triacylglycerol lipase